jgi:CHAT domain-containing protein
MQTAPHSTFHRRHAGKALVVLALPIVLTAAPRDTSKEPVAAAADVLSSSRISPRLSITTSTRRCREAAPASGSVTRPDCPALSRLGARRLRLYVDRLRSRVDDPAALHVFALTQLVVARENESALDSAIAALKRAGESADKPASLLADLSAALIIRAEQLQTPRNLLEAYEAADSALQHEPRNAAALYNRALALDRFGLVDEAARDWQKYLDVESRSRWAAAARRRRRALFAVKPVPPPADDAPLRAYARYASAEPQAARELGMTRLLAEWGSALLARDPAQARNRLRRATVLGESLANRVGGDASVADAVRDIVSAASSPSETERLARAHRAYGAAHRELASGEYARAKRLFVAAEELAGETNLREWVRTSLTLVPFERDSPRYAEEPQRTLHSVLATISHERYPALVAQARWSLARAPTDWTIFDRNADEASKAAELFALSGERENEGAAAATSSGIHFFVGNKGLGHQLGHRAVVRLRPYRSSIYLSSQLFHAASVAASDGLHKSAVRLLNEALVLAADPAVIAQGYMRRSQVLASLGDMEGARTNIRYAQYAAQSIGQADMRRRFEAALLATEATVLFEDVRERVLALDSAAALYRRLGSHEAAQQLLIRAALEIARKGNAGDATRRATALFYSLRWGSDWMDRDPVRAVVVDSARRLVDEVVFSKLTSGLVSEALCYLDQARASFSRLGMRSVGCEGEVSAVPGETVVEYSLIHETLLVWVVKGQNVQFHQTVVDTVRFAQIASEMEQKLDREASEREIRPLLSELHHILIHPIEHLLADSESPLVIIVDGNLASIPFGALYNGRRQRYLIEDYPVRYDVSLRSQHHPPLFSRGGRVLLVANPAFDAREHPQLDQLGGATAEVDSILKVFGEADVLKGSEATRWAVESGLYRVEVAHFAGHAVYDEVRPARSYLVLAPSTGTERSGRISAAELMQMDLRHLRLVVLSACKTMHTERSRVAGYTNLTGALLAAGVRGTIGSTWSVNDRWAATLMPIFYRAYERSGDGPRALQTAQLKMLRSSNPEVRSPAAWAAFRYAGQ